MNPGYPGGSRESRSCSEEGAAEMKRSASDSLSSEEDEEQKAESMSTSGSSVAEAVLPDHANSLGESNVDARRRAAAEQRIASFFYQLSHGCGRVDCMNNNCRSSGKIGILTPNEAALRAVQCVKQGAVLCAGIELSPPPTGERRSDRSGCAGTGSRPAAKLAKQSPDIVASCGQQDSLLPPTSCGVRDDSSMSSNSSSTTSTTLISSSGTPTAPFVPSPREIVYLTESTLATLVEDCVATGDYTPFIRKIGKVFSSSESMNRSFLKEEIYNSKDFAQEPDGHKVGKTNLDIPSIRRAFTVLQKVPEDVYVSPLTNILVLLFDAVELELKFRSVLLQDPSYLNLFVIVMEMPMLPKEEFHTTVLPALCKASAQLPLLGQAGLARIWSRFEASRLRACVQMIQNHITFRVISGNHNNNFGVNDDDAIVSPTCLLKILYYASLYGAPRDVTVTFPETVLEGTAPAVATSGSSAAFSPPGSGSDDAFDDFFAAAASVPSSSSAKKEGNPLDPLALELGVQAIDVREPLVPFADFYNEPLSEAVEMDRDYSYFRADHHRFSFMNNAFILTPSTKALGLFFDSRIRMNAVRRMNLIQSAISGTVSQPYLKVAVRRDNLIEDALTELEMVSMQNPGDLRKQLVVEFVNEQGVDEGGVSKEFFQLIVESIFNPDYAMFMTDPETNIAWFNPTSFETDRQYTLIGIIFGLAIYNNIILNVNFPRVVYKKLMGRRGTFHDLKDYNPVSLAQLLEELSRDRMYRRG